MGQSGDRIISSNITIRLIARHYFVFQPVLFLYLCLFTSSWRYLRNGSNPPPYYLQNVPIVTNGNAYQKFLCQVNGFFNMPYTHGDSNYQLLFKGTMFISNNRLGILAMFVCFVALRASQQL